MSLRDTILTEPDYDFVVPITIDGMGISEVLDLLGFLTKIRDKPWTGYSPTDPDDNKELNDES